MRRAPIRKVQAIPDTPVHASARAAAVVVCATLPVWLLLTWIGGALGLPPRFVFLVDFAALGAFAWALIVLCRVWLAGPGEGNGKC